MTQKLHIFRQFDPQQLLIKLKHNPIVHILYHRKQVPVDSRKNSLTTKKSGQTAQIGSEFKLFARDLHSINLQLSSWGRKFLALEKLDALSEYVHSTDAVP